MKKHLTYLIILGLLIPLFSNSQELNRSYIYNFKGQLRIDTSFNITQKQYKVWCMVETNLLSHISSSIDFSPFLREINKTGIVIISFECDTFELKNIKAINRIGEGIDSASIEGINKIKDKLILEFRLTEKFKKQKQIDYLGTYYIPIDFNLIDLKENMKNSFTIPIIGTKPVGISRDIE